MLYNEIEIKISSSVLYFKQVFFSQLINFISMKSKKKAVHKSLIHWIKSNENKTQHTHTHRNIYYFVKLLNFKQNNNK